MLINLSDIFMTEDKVLKTTYELEAEKLFYRGDQYQILDKSPVSLELENAGKGKAFVRGEAEFIIEMFCDRCLKPIKKGMKINFEHLVNAPEAVTIEPKAETEPTDEYDFMEGYQLNIEELICNEILINWPTKVLCKPDCKGICAVCGKDLNAGQCECDTFVPDPRMAVIKDIFNANKEV